MINCRKCKYLFVTWDIKKPYGCRAIGFKSQVMPSVEVYRASGKECIKFQKKEEQKK